MRRHPEHMRIRADRHAARRRLKPEVRRAELVDAALSVLSTQDPATVRVEDVTKAAGAAKGTFYLYFSSWDELLAAVRDRVMAAYTTEALDRFALAGTAEQWWEAVDDECAHFIDHHIKIGTLHQALFHGPVTEHPVAAEHSADLVVARILRQGMALGACRPIDPEIAAALAFAVLHAAADGTVQTGDREKWLETLSVLIRAWLQPPASRKD